ncbi:MAG: flagellar motor protein MotB [Armatimonadetes bacterium]|nr:flagellar motor protein MotB [Armatimonadota bacterium]MBS1710961.1 flagellar motor protein MotB [Armatimonadota bacterium]MBX3108633.1 flagellar motor protein MotB [Fimbriimonadaceae bacterium]
MQEGTPIIVKKVKKGGHGHHGGAWKVAYADFVTAMMAFFMVMWILGMSQDQKEAIAAYFNDPTGFHKTVPTFKVGIGPVAQPRSLQNSKDSSGDDGLMKEKAAMDNVQRDLEKAVSEDKDLKKLAQNGDLQVSQTNEGLVLELIENEAGGEVFFKIGSSSIRDQARLVFRKLAPVLAKTGRPMKIDGHTDARPYPGSGYDNFDLSSDRANEVRRLMMASGISPSQIIGAEGRADTDLRKPDDPYHFSNRRVTVLLPYKYLRGDTVKMPTEIHDESVEGVFVNPAGPRDAIRKKIGEAQTSSQSEGH